MNKLSIIVPCYNEEKTILSVIDEIRQFTDKDKEVIIVDDGSTDETKNILKEIEEGKFNESDFNKLAENIKIKSALIKSVDDNSLFNIDSLKMLFTIPKGDFLLIVDNSNNIYLTKVEN